MIDLGFYERVVAIRSPKKNNMRKVIISALCGLALAVWIACALVMGAGVVACVLISVLIVAVPFVVTSFSANELEYAISADSVTLAMIYNGRRRKEIFWAEADDILLIAPNTEDNRKTAQAYEPREKFSATTESGELDEWLIVFKDEKDEKYLFTFEADGGVQKLLKAIKPSAFKVR
jgi:hypothetical protein